METIRNRDDECPFCRDRYEIVQVRFGLRRVSFVSVCPNCGLIAISPISADHKPHPLLNEAKRAAKAFALSLKRPRRLPLSGRHG